MRAARIGTHSVAEIAPKIRAWVDPAAVLGTDKLPAYRGVGAGQAAHLRVDHGRKEYARADPATEVRAHVNSAEGFGSQVRRCVAGTRNRISPKHLDRHLAEVAFRHDQRRAAAPARVGALLAAPGPPLGHRALVA